MGIDERHVAASHECASDLAVAAATKLFASGRASPGDIDYVIDMADCGNTGSSTVAIALRRAMARGPTRAGMRVMLVGFGVGYSWGATLLEWI